MKNQILQLMFILLVSFEGLSIHSGPMLDGSDFNAEHELIGIEYQNENISISYTEYKNSSYNDTRMLKLNYMPIITEYGRFGFSVFNVTGYFFKYGALPVANLSYDNIELEFSIIPPLDELYGVGVIMLTKKVKF